MLQRPEDDKIVQTNHYERDMSLTLKDGTKVPVKGKVTEKVHFSGKVDVSVEIDKPFHLNGDNPPPQTGLPQ